MTGKSKDNDIVHNNRATSDAVVNVGVRLEILSITAPTNTSGQLDVLALEGHTVDVDRTQVRMVEHLHNERLSGLLDGIHGIPAPTNTCFVCDVVDHTRERHEWDEEFTVLLVLANLTQGHGAWTVAVRFLHTAGGGGSLSGCLGAGLGRGPAPIGLGGLGLLGAGHRVALLGWVNGDTRAGQSAESKFLRHAPVPVLGPERALLPRSFQSARSPSALLVHTPRRKDPGRRDPR